jgi:HK97 family phage portal protein
MGFLDWTKNKLAPPVDEEKLNPAQSFISGGGGVEAQSQEQVISFQLCYEKIEIVNRAVNMIVDDTAAIKNKVGDQIAGMTPLVTGVRKITLERLLNKEPNPFQDVNSFKRALVLDLILDGNIFIYWDGSHLYHLPAVNVTVVSDKKTFISHYDYNGSIRYETNEIIHVKDNTYKTLFRGSSRLQPALRTMSLIMSMREFQDNFFRNGAVPGLVLKTDETLNQRLKDRLISEWTARYRPGSGGKRPIILDGGMSVDSISSISFKELDFQQAIMESEKTILKALGVPPILVDAGNNANIRPNHRLFYLETVMPIIEKINSAYERFFGFEVFEDLTYIEALRPELSDQADYYQSLVNGGVISPNEARQELGREPKPGHDDLRIPQNIAGSAADPSQGGRPPKEPNEPKK